MKKIIDVTLPEWAWLDGSDHENNGNQLDGRDVLLHVRSASVIEFFEEGDFVPNSTAKCHRFEYANADGDTERYIAVLHYCAATNDESIISDILKAASEWYADYMEWEDRNIIESDRASLN